MTPGQPGSPAIHAYWLKLVGLAVGVSLLPTAVFLWRLGRVEAELAAVRAALVASSDPATNPGGRATAAPPLETPAVPRYSNSPPPDRQMTYDLFERHWSPTFAAEAEAKCWKPLGDKAKDLIATPQYMVEVDRDGSVVSVQRYGVIAMDPNPVYDCVAGVIKTMKFPAPGQRHSGPAQATRLNLKP